VYKRHLEEHIKGLIKQYRCITLVGPRQSGKTTLSKKLFPEYEYFSFESPDIQDMFEYDPRGFFQGIKGVLFLMRFKKYLNCCHICKKFLMIRPM